MCLGLQHALGRTLTLNALVSEGVAGTWMVLEYLEGLLVWAKKEFKSSS